MSVSQTRVPGPGRTDLLRLGARIAVASVLATLLSPAPAHADEGTGYAHDVMIPAERGSQWFYLESLDLRGHGRMALGLMGVYTYRSLVERDARGIDVAVVRHQATLHAGASFVFYDRLRLGFDLPLQVAADGTTAVLDGARQAIPPNDQVGPGDPRLSFDVRLFGRYGEGATAAVGAQVFVPAGTTQSFGSDGAHRIRPRFMYAYDKGPFAFAAMTGVQVRGRDEAWAHGHVGTEMFASVAIGARLAHGLVFVGPEIQASTVLSGGAAFQKEATPVEGLLGSRIELLPHVRLGAAIGTGLVRGYGAPAYRGLAVLEWVPDRPPPPEPEPSEVPPDRDGDGVPDAEDACGFVPGFKSPFPDRNGCPYYDTAPKPPAPTNETPAPDEAPSAPSPLTSPPEKDDAHPVEPAPSGEPLPPPAPPSPEPPPSEPKEARP